MIRPDGEVKLSNGYNFRLLTNGKGRLIPQYGFTEFITPHVLTEEYQISNGKLQPVSITPPTSQTYIVSTSDTQPYFSPDDASLFKF